MTEDGNPRENTIAERVNGILKVEMGMGQEFQNIRRARTVLKREVQIYNQKRPHISIALFTPEQAHENSWLYRT